MFEINKEQKDIFKAAMEFAEGELTDIAAECDQAEKFPNKAWEKACEFGFIGIAIEEKYDGAGMGILDYVLLLEAFAGVDPGCGNMLYSTIGYEYIQKYGNEAQKSKYLPPLAVGKSMSGTVIDQGGIYESFEYEKTPDGSFTLSGSNNFVINGDLADYLVITAREKQDKMEENTVYSTFIIEKNTSGLTKQTMVDKLGVRATNFAEIKLNDVKIAADTLIGTEGDALRQMEYFLSLLNIYSSAQAIGMSQACLEKSIRYSRQREQFGHPIGWFQLTKFKISDMHTKIEASRALLYKTAFEFDQGAINARKAAIAASIAKETAMMVTGETMQIHAGYGYMKEMDIERFYRDVQFLEIIGHSKEDGKILVATDLLGKL